jgi:transcriptional regulator with XRE-family HTH domain
MACCFPHPSAKNGKKFLKLLGSRIREIRKLKGLSQVDLGIRMDNYGEQIGRIERGELNVTVCTLKKIAESLEISLSQLMDF